MIDNGLSAQEQDYLPGRFLLQKEIIDSVITQALEMDPEGCIGIIPLAKANRNDIMTPTRARMHLSLFLDKCDLQREQNLTLSLFQAEKSFETKEFSNRTLIIFFCSPVSSVDEVIANLYGVAAKNITLHVICFGDASELGETLKKEVCFDNFHCLVVTPNQDFTDCVNSFLGNTLGTYDPDLQEAIRQSLLTN